MQAVPTSPLSAPPASSTIGQSPISRPVVSSNLVAIEGVETLELIRNTKVRLDDWRLPMLMSEISDLSKTCFELDITVTWEEFPFPPSVGTTLYHLEGGMLDVLVEHGSAALAGFISYYVDDGEGDDLDLGPCMLIDHVAVSERFRKFGLGRLLVSFAIDAARHKGRMVNRVMLLAVNDSRPFYEGIGFRCKDGDEDAPGDVWMAMEVLPDPGSSDGAADSQVPSTPFAFDDSGLVYSAFGHPSAWEKPMPFPLPTLVPLSRSSADVGPPPETPLGLFSDPDKFRTAFARAVTDCPEAEDRPALPSPAGSTRSSTASAGGNPAFRLNRRLLQGRWRHSLRHLGMLTVHGNMMWYESGPTRGRSFPLTHRHEGLVEVLGCTASPERSTANEIVWLKDGERVCSWHRL